MPTLFRNGPKAFPAPGRARAAGFFRPGDALYWAAAGLGTSPLDVAGGVVGAATSDAAIDYAPMLGYGCSASGTAAIARVNFGLPDVSDPGADDFTVAAFFRMDVKRGGYAVLARWLTGATPSACMWSLGSNSPGLNSPIAFSIAVGGTIYGATVNVNGAAGLTAGLHYMMFGRRRGTSLFVDVLELETGTLYAGVNTSGPSGAVNSVPARTLNLGAFDLGAAYNVDLTYSWVALSRSYWGDEIIDELMQNPAAVFEKEAAWLWAVPAGGAAAELAGDAAAAASATGDLSTGIPLAGAALAIATAAGDISTAIALAGTGAAQASATGALTAQIRLDADALAVATAAAALSTGIPLAGDAIAAAAATGALTTGGDELEGAAIAQAIATGDLSTAILLAGDALAQAAAAAGLSTGVQLAGAAQASSLAQATITAQIRLAGAAAATAAATGDLGGGAAALAGAAQAIATASGALGTGIVLGGSASAQAAGAGALTTGIPLAGAAVSAAVASGVLTVTIALDGAALAQALAGGGLTVAIQLVGAAQAQASASGTLTGGAELLAVNPRYVLDAPPRLLVVDAPRRLLEVSR